jgi:2-iminoacetate synthase
VSITDVIEACAWRDATERIRGASAADVERALERPGRGRFEDFCALVSPAAAPYLEPMARFSAALTRRRFGKTIQLFVPMYVSNECTNVCTYCGFSLGNKIPRLTLSDAQILGECAAIRALGFDHVLLVSGESAKHVDAAYFANALRLCRGYFANLSIEVQPLEEREYRALTAEGLHAVLVYQETYNRERYRLHHPKGKKANFDFRLETPDRLGRAEVHKIGLGVLLGLDDWRADSALCAMHLEYLRRKYWKTKFSISFPRLRPAEGVTIPVSPMSERDVVQLVLAWRIFDENVELSLSTREHAPFRDRLIPLGVTAMSAGSRTEPGGYALKSRALRQFDTSDERSPSEVAAKIRELGFDPVWKDWDAAFSEGAAA